MIFDIGTVRSEKSGFTTLAQVCALDSEFHEDLTLDFQNCSFFDANMAAPLSAAIQRVKGNFRSIELKNLPNLVAKILRKNHFLCDYGHSSLFDENQTTLPHTNFDAEDAHNFARYLNKHLKGKGIPEMSEGLDRRFRQSIFEIFQNCATHSESDLGVFVCGQFYPQQHKLKLTIADAGIGIRTNVRRVHDRNINSVDAIKWALLEGNTSKTGDEPGGFGLKLLHEFIQLNKGQVQIASRLGYYRFDGTTEYFSKMNSDLFGTTISLEINTDDKSSYSLASEISPDDIF